MFELYLIEGVATYVKAKKWGYFQFIATVQGPRNQGGRYPPIQILADTFTLFQYIMPPQHHSVLN